jgi:L-rhamnose-H+ transport protein
VVGVQPGFLVVLPWALALLLVDHLGAVYEELDLSKFAAPVLFGAGWGAAQVLFGISVARLGLGVAYSIIVGLGAVLGTLVPLFRRRASVGQHGRLSALAWGSFAHGAWRRTDCVGGHLREKSARSDEVRAPRRGYLVSILLAVLCGLMAPMLNYSFAFGQGIAHKAVALGNSPVRAAYSVYPIALAGGFVPNLAYSVYLLARNRSVSAFRKPIPDALFSSVMAALWMGAFALYGMSAVLLGPLGTSIEDIGIVGQATKLKVKLQIGLQQFRRPRFLCCAAHHLQRQFERLDIVAPHRQQSRSEPFQGAPHLIDMQDILFCKVDDARAAARSFGNKAFLCEKVDGLAD